MLEDGASEYFARLFAEWVLKSIAAGWLRHNFVSQAEWWGTWTKTMALCLEEAGVSSNGIETFGEALWRQLGWTIGLQSPAPGKDSLLYGSFREFVGDAKLKYAEWVLTR